MRGRGRHGRRLLILLIVTQWCCSPRMCIRWPGRNMGARMHLHVGLSLIHVELQYVKQPTCSTNRPPKAVWVQAKDNTTPREPDGAVLTSVCQDLLNRRLSLVLPIDRFGMQQKPFVYAHLFKPSWGGQKSSGKVDRADLSKATNPESTQSRRLRSHQMVLGQRSNPKDFESNLGQPCGLALSRSSPTDSLFFSQENQLSMISARSSCTLNTN